jgi:hypothetical protein
MEVFVGVVPVDTHSLVSGAGPVLRALVVFIEDAGEMVNMFVSNVFDAKIIYTKSE